MDLPDVAAALNFEIDDLPGRGFSAQGSQQQLDTAIGWARYAELFDYDTDSDQITADPAAGISPRRRAASSVA